MMDEARFKTLADAYGGAVSRWPEQDRADAEAFMQAAPERAGAILAEAAVLDRELAQVGPAEPGPALYDAVLTSWPGRPAAPPARWAGLAAAIALTVGAGSGWFAAGGVDQAGYEDAVFAEAFGALEGAETLDAVMEEEVR